MSLWSTFWVPFVPAHPVASDVYPTLISLWTIWQVTAFHLPSPICSQQWCNSLKFRDLVGTTKLKLGAFLFLNFTHSVRESVVRIGNMCYICCAGNIQGQENKVEGWFWAKEICLTLPTQHQLRLFPQLTASIVFVGLKWSHIKGLCLCRVDSLVLCTAQQGDSYLSQLLTAAQINTSPPLQGEEDNSTAANSLSLFILPSSSTSQVHNAAGHLRHEQVHCWWTWASLRPVSGLVLSARYVRTGEDRLARL